VKRVTEEEHHYAAARICSYARASRAPTRCAAARAARLSRALSPRCAAARRACARQRQKYRIESGVAMKKTLARNRRRKIPGISQPESENQMATGHHQRRIGEKLWRLAKAGNAKGVIG